jgi:seryl-tRNA synthetase
MTSALSNDSGAAAARLDEARRGFQRDLLNAGLLLQTSVTGLYGRSAVFESIIDGIDAARRRAGPGDAATRYSFPAIFPRAAFEGTGYIASFPNLTGAISTFTGDNRAHAGLLAARAEGEPWDDFLSPTDTMLVSAACHPAYALLAGTLPPEGVLLEVCGSCFRHEPSVDPARMQAFRMHEFVRVGTPQQASDHREQWIDKALAVLTELGLEATPVIANDPFFGRAGRILANNQRAENLKTELVVRLYGDLDDGTAVVSCNYHEDHFGAAFGITTADGAVAHSACMGFGMERIALALLRTHGLDPKAWPAAVRAAMELA